MLWVHELMFHLAANVKTDIPNDGVDLLSSAVALLCLILGLEGIAVRCR